MSRLQGQGRERLVCAILAIALPFTSSAASQLEPFFNGLKAAQNRAELEVYIKASKPSPDSLALSEELPALVQTLQENNAIVSYVAGQYLMYLAGLNSNQPKLRVSFREALPALAAHFDDPAPDPDLILLHNGYNQLTSGWQGIVFAYIQFAGLTLPPNLIPAALRALDGANWGGAIEQLSRLKPLPPEVLRALIEKFHKSGNAAERGQVIIKLNLAGQTDQQFVDLVIETLSSPDRDLLGAAVEAAWNLGAAMKSALPILRRIAETHPFNDSTKFTAGMIVEDLEAGKYRSKASDRKTQADIRDSADVEAPDPESMRVAAYFDFLKTASPEERRRLLAKDLRQGPFARTLAPAEDLPVLVEILRGNDPDLAASAARHLGVMALRNIGAGTMIRENIASALPAMAAHYDDPNPPIMSPTDPPGSWQYEVIGFVWLSGAQPPAPLVSKILVALQEDGMALSAAEALAQLKPMPESVLAAILQRMRVSEWEIQNQIIGALVENGVNQPAFVQALGVTLDTPGAHHQAAAMALSSLGAAAKPAEPALRRFLSKAASPDTEEANAQLSARMALKNLTDK